MQVTLSQYRASKGYVKMSKKIAILRGHPDPAQNHFCDAIIEHYKHGAEEAGHVVQVVDVASLDFSILRTSEEWTSGTVAPGLEEAQDTFFWADHIVLVYPLWLGTMPALFKAFLEQVLRAKLNSDGEGNPVAWRKLMQGTSARIIITMGMPALFYRVFYRSHGLKVLSRNILSTIGVGPVRSTLFGLIENVSQAKRMKWLDKVQKLGMAAK